MVVFWLRSDVPNWSSRTAQTASEVAETVTWLGSAIARPLKCARTHAHNDAECASGWLVWYGCGALAAFHDWRSALHRRSLDTFQTDETVIVARFLAVGLA